MFSSPYIISGDDQRFSMTVRINNNFWILELSVGFETNLINNINAKNVRYTDINFLTGRLKTSYINKSEYSHLQLFSDLKVDKSHSNYVLPKYLNVCIHTMYCLFSFIDKIWLEPPLISWSCFF